MPYFRRSQHNHSVILSDPERSKGEPKDLRLVPASTKRSFFDSLRSLRMTIYL
jgi:hypothetical protein